MGDMNMIEDVCVECGRLLDGDDDDLCVSCIQDIEEAVRQRFRQHLEDDRDGKRLDKSKRPKHKPTPEREKPIPMPPKKSQIERAAESGRSSTGRPQRQTDGRPQERR
jgi:hypothetical protein